MRSLLVALLLAQTILPVLDRTLDNVPYTSVSYNAVGVPTAWTAGWAGWTWDMVGWHG